MATTNIKPVFNSENEGNMMRIVGLCTIFFTFIPPLVAYFALSETSSPENKEIYAELANFNIIGAIAITICTIIPFIGWLALPLVGLFFFIMNIIIAIQIINGSEVKIPIILQLIKINK